MHQFLSSLYSLIEGLEMIIAIPAGKIGFISYKYARNTKSVAFISYPREFWGNGLPSETA